VSMVSRSVPTANDEPAADDLAEYPDSLDAGLLRIAGVCILASVMAILDGTVVSVAQRTFIAEFASTQAVVAWTITGYTLGQATVIPLAGWASDRFGTKRLFMGAALWFTLASLLCSMASNISQLIAMKVRCATLTTVPSKIAITEARMQTPAMRSRPASSESGYSARSSAAGSSLAVGTARETMDTRLTRK